MLNEKSFLFFFFTKLNITKLKMRFFTHTFHAFYTFLEENLSSCVNLFARWQALKKVADQKKGTLQLAHNVNTFHIEAAETMVNDVVERWRVVAWLFVLENSC